MVTTVCFYIFIGIIGLFGLALIIASIASLVHNLRRNSRVKKYVNEEQKKQPEQQHNKAPSQYHNQEHKKYIVNDSRPVVITQSGYDDQRVTIGYVPNGSTLRVGQTVQANAGYKAEKKRKPIKNKTNTSKVHRNNSCNIKNNKNISKTKLNNKNIKSDYNSRLTQRTYRRNNFT